MRHSESVDYYEILQVSRAADREMIQAAYRMLARRYHPDNQESGDAALFRHVSEAYDVLGDPKARATYDAFHRERPGRRTAPDVDTTAASDLQREQACRMRILEALYTRRRTEPDTPTVLPAEIMELTGRTREQLEFAMWFLNSKGLVQRADNSGLSITAAGVEYLEQHYDPSAQRRLPETILRTA